MRKGLVVTLGVVTLLLVASQSFSIAPVISSIPDIIVSDIEQHSATVDNNFFIFSDALDLDELVRDDDTTRSTLKWFFLQSSGPSISLNGITQYTGTNYTNPGASDIRAVNRNVTVRNILWSPTTGSAPFADPGVASADSLTQWVVTDQTKVDSQPVVITSLNTGLTTPTATNVDRLVGELLQSYDFATGPQGWTFTAYNDPATTISAATNPTVAGSLAVAETATQSPTVYGTWQSPSIPTATDAIHMRWGTVLRARYQVRATGTTDPDGFDCPGFRMRASWAHMIQSGSSWIVDLLNADTLDDYELNYLTMNLAAANIGVPGRSPGATAKEFTLLYYPQQIETLSSSDTVSWVSFDLLDVDFFGNDAGTLVVDQVDIDVFDRPDPSVGTAVATLTASNFSAWTGTAAAIATAPGPPFGPGNATGMTPARSATSIAFTQTGTNKWAVAESLSDTVAKLTPGAYYRTRLIVTSSQASGQFGPTLRASCTSSRGAWAANKNMFGGGTWSQIRSDPTEFELWYVAPSSTNATYASQTEDMKIRAQSYITFNPAVPANKTIAGVLTITNVTTQQMPTP